MSAANEKAKILVFDYKGKQIDTIEVSYNPDKYSVEKIANWSQKKKSKTPHFVGNEIKSFTVNLFFDTYEQGTNVRDKTGRIVKLMNPTIEHKKQKVPPICVFSWGKFNYRGVIEKVTQNFTLFLGTGIPVRALLNVTFKPPILPEERAKGDPPGDPTTTRVIREGETLNLISSEEYGDPSLWRIIADENKMTNPRDINAGTPIIIPALID